MAGSEAPFGARIYFLANGSIFVRQTVLGKGGIYQCDDWRGATCRAGDAERLMKLVELAREGQLPPCDSHGNPTAPRTSYLPTATAPLDSAQ